MTLWQPAGNETVKIMKIEKTVIPIILTIEDPEVLVVVLWLVLMQMLFMIVIVVIVVVILFRHYRRHRCNRSVLSNLHGHCSNNVFLSLSVLGSINGFVAVICSRSTVSSSV